MSVPTLLTASSQHPQPLPLPTGVDVIPGAYNAVMPVSASTRSKASVKLPASFRGSPG